MIVYEMFSKCDSAAYVDLPEPTSDWRRDVYAGISCPHCWDVLPQHRDAPIDIELSAKLDPKNPLPGLKHFVALEMVRVDLLQVLRKWMDDYRIGRVMYDGTLLTEFCSVLARTGARVHPYGDERSKYESCKVCGRLCIATPNKYYKAGDIGDRQVFAGVAGVGWTVSERVRNAIPRVIYRRLQFFPVPVRE